jgi:hypothetical protein
VRPFPVLLATGSAKSASNICHHVSALSLENLPNHIHKSDYLDLHSLLMYKNPKYLGFLIYNSAAPCVSPPARPSIFPDYCTYNRLWLLSRLADVKQSYVLVPPQSVKRRSIKRQSIKRQSVKFCKSDNPSKDNPSKDNPSKGTIRQQLRSVKFYNIGPP